MTTLLDGREVADSLLTEAQARVESLKKQGKTVKLVVILVGEDPASEVYVRNKAKACEKVGILSEIVKYPISIKEEELIEKIRELNADPSVNGMIVQVPLPAHIDPSLVVRAIDPNKDADGFHAYNLGKMFLSLGFEGLAPATPLGIIHILEYYELDPTGMNAVVIGRSNTVGKPLATMLLNRNATVTVCHRYTKDLTEYTRRADLIVVAMGQPKFLKADMVKEGAIIIDVGINRLSDGTLCGDADFDALQGKASHITPVPGGVGRTTVAALLLNTVTAAEKQSKI